MATLDAPTQKDIGPRKALGRGLAALMPGGSPVPSQIRSGPMAMPPAQVNSGYRVLPIERLHPNKSQPRKQFHEEALADLTLSIKTQGVLQPILVRRSGKDYEIVAGERRWRAANRAGLQEIPVVIKELTDSAALQIAIIENVQRQDLDPLEEAEAYGRLIREHHLTHDQVSEAVGKSRSAITNSLRLLKLPEDVLVMLADGRLTAGHARALMTLDDERAMVRLAEDVAGRHASVREAEAKAKALLKGKKKAPAPVKNSAAEASVEERLQQALGTKVRLQQRKGKGHIEIYFHSLEALEGILDQIIKP